MFPRPTFPFGPRNICNNFRNYLTQHLSEWDLLGLRWTCLMGQEKVSDDFFFFFFPHCIPRCYAMPRLVVSRKAEVNQDYRIIKKQIQLIEYIKIQVVCICALIKTDITILIQTFSKQTWVLPTSSRGLSCCEAFWSVPSIWTHTAPVSEAIDILVV